MDNDDDFKCESRLALVNAENEILRNEKAACEAEIYRLNIAKAELTEKIDNLERMNSDLINRLREASNSLEDANRRINNLTAANVALTAERDSLAAGLRDTEDALKDAETKLANANAAIAACKADTEQRLSEKDAEIEIVRKNGQRAIQDLQRTLDEVKAYYKSEIARLKKTARPKSGNLTGRRQRQTNKRQ